MNEAVNEAVLDASVVLKWFASEQRGSAEARQLRREYEEGRLIVVAPELLFLELVNVAGRRWGWNAEALVDLAAALEDLALDIGGPRLEAVASWVVRGLTAYDAVYVALAEERGMPLVTDDAQILEVAPVIARPLVGGPSR